MTTEPLLTFTSSAVDYIQQWLKKDNAVLLRLSVKKTGCNGWSYVTEVASNINPEDHTHTYDNGLCVSIAPDSASYLRGLEIDYVTQGLGQKKIVFRNPNARSHCGCGESFNIDK